MIAQTSFIYDTHMHSHYSDGDYAPADVVAHAYAAGLRGIILADHNTVAGYQEFNQSCQEYQMPTLMGVEVSTRWHDQEVHILGYAYTFDVARLREGLRPNIEGYNERSAKMIELLRQHDETALTFDDIRARKPTDAPITKYDIARAIAEERELPASEHPALAKQYVERGAIAYVPYGKSILSPEEACGVIAQAGGISVFAHPGKHSEKNPDGVQAGRDMIAQLVSELTSVGLRGIEIRCYAHNNEAELFYTRIAEQNNLLCLGSTDWHGDIHHPTRIFGEKGSTQQEFDALLHAMS